MREGIAANCVSGFWRDWLFVPLKVGEGVGVRVGGMGEGEGERAVRVLERLRDGYARVRAGERGQGEKGKEEDGGGRRGG